MGSGRWNPKTSGTLDASDIERFTTQVESVGDSRYDAREELQGFEDTSGDLVLGRTKSGKTATKDSKSSDPSAPIMTPTLCQPGSVTTTPSPAPRKVWVTKRKKVKVWSQHTCVQNWQQAPEGAAQCIGQPL